VSEGLELKVKLRGVLITSLAILSDLNETTQASVLGQQQRVATVEEIIEKRVRQHEDSFATGVSESVPSHRSRGDDVARFNTSLVVATHADMHLATPVARRGRRPKRRLEKDDKNVVGESMEVPWVPRGSLSAVPSSVSELDRHGSASLTTEGAGVSANGQGVASAADSMVFAADHLLGMSEVSQWRHCVGRGARRPSGHNREHGYFRGKAAQCFPENAKWSDQAKKERAAGSRADEGRKRKDDAKGGGKGQCSFGCEWKGKRRMVIPKCMAGQDYEEFSLWHDAGSRHRLHV